MYKEVLFIMTMINQTVASAEYSAADIVTDTITIPETVEGIKSPTLNGTGYVFYTISPVGKAFLEEECKPGRSIIEIGAGYSNIPIEALKRGVSPYVANDISIEHLKILAHRVKETSGENALENLTLMPVKAPQELPKSPQKYDAILADKVIHFMKPDEIKEFIEWSKSSLKRGGKLYVTTASPYSKLYTKILPEYISRLKEGKEFPGHFTSVMTNCNASNLPNYKQYSVPNEMVLFSRNDLIKLFENQGMKVIESYSLTIPTADQSEWIQSADEESNIVGVIVVHGK